MYGKSPTEVKHSMIQIWAICIFAKNIFLSDNILNQHFNPFNPGFLKWTLPSLSLDTSILANRV